MKQFRYNGGTADYLFEQQIPPAWLVAAVPGASAAHRAWQSANTKGAELARAFQRSSRDLVAFRRTNPLAVELESAERAHDDLRRAVDDATRESLAKIRAFDAKFTADGEDVKHIAAAYALEQQAVVERAWATFLSAVKDRSEAYRGAGKPGIDWVHRASLGAKGDHGDGGERYALEVLNALVHGFPMADVQAVADQRSEVSE